MSDRLAELSDRVVTLELGIREREKEITKLKIAKSLILNDVLEARKARERNHTLQVEGPSEK